MSSAIAFFPWWAVPEAVTWGPIRLIPYQRGQAPGDGNGVAQADLDAMLQAYATRPGKPIRRATLLEVDTWRLGEDPEPVLRRFFTAREAIGFAGLAARNLFEGHFGYGCFHNFSLVVQRYQPGKGDMFAFTMRRRDGGARHVWSTDEFAFQCPLHVDSNARMPPLDAALVQLLMDDTLPVSWSEAITEYNHANTDSIDVPTHVEMVMMKSAFELLFSVNPDARSFEHALTRLLTTIPAPPSPVEGPLAAKWMQAFPRSSRLYQAWAREFCSRRGAAAHGSKRGAHFVWSEAAHLVFASLLFPLVLKKLASEQGRYAISAEDLERLSRIDEYLAHEPMDFREDDEQDLPAKHPWREIDLDIRMRALSQRMYPQMMAAIEEGLAASNAATGVIDSETQQLTDFEEDDGGTHVAP